MIDGLHAESITQARLPNEMWWAALSLIPNGMRLPVRAVCRLWRDLTPVDTEDVRVRCAREGCIDLLRWIHERLGAPWTPKETAAIASRGDVGLLRTVREWGAPWDASACYAAARCGCVPMLEWIRSNGGAAMFDGPYRRCFVIAAIGGDHAGCILYLHRMGCLAKDSVACIEAARKGAIRCLDSMLDLGLCDDRTAGEAAVHAARAGRLSCLRLLLERAGANGVSALRATDCMDAALAGGHVPCVRFLHEDLGCPLEERDWLIAARAGRLKALAYLHERGCRWHPDACRSAAASGRPECLRFVRGCGCPWDERTTLAAATFGHLECLRYARENGCAWDARVPEYAALGGHLDCLRYAHAMGCPYRPAMLQAFAQVGGTCLGYVDAVMLS